MMRDPEQTIGNLGTVEVLEDTEGKEFFSCFFLFIDKTDDIK